MGKGSFTRYGMQCCGGIRWKLAATLRGSRPGVQIAIRIDHYDVIDDVITRKL